jgi:hypothetical protein
MDLSRCLRYFLSVLGQFWYKSLFLLPFSYGLRHERGEGERETERERLLDSSGKEKKKIIDTDLCHQDN